MISDLSDLLDLNSAANDETPIGDILRGITDRVLIEEAQQVDLQIASPTPDLKEKKGDLIFQQVSNIFEDLCGTLRSVAEKGVSQAFFFLCDCEDGSDPKPLKMDDAEAISFADETLRRMRDEYCANVAFWAEPELFGANVKWQIAEVIFSKDEAPVKAKTEEIGIMFRAPCVVIFSVNQPFREGKARALIVDWSTK